MKKSAGGPGGRKGPRWVQGKALACGPGGRRPPRAPLFWSFLRDSGAFPEPQLSLSFPEYTKKRHESSNLLCSVCAPSKSVHDISSASGASRNFFKYPI
jgi:hypothetical protein